MLLVLASQFIEILDAETSSAGQLRNVKEYILVVCEIKSYTLTVVMQMYFS